MRRPAIPNYRASSTRRYGSKSTRPPIISIANLKAFYRNHPNSIQADSKTNPPLFENLKFELPSFPETPSYWAVIGASSSGKTTFLQTLLGQHVSFPASARSYPYLTSEGIENQKPKLPSQAIAQVGFDGEIGGQAPKSAYLSARYESRREETDFSVLDYLKGNTELNPSQKLDENSVDLEHLSWVLKNLKLLDLTNMPVSNLSNGQTRRARIAKALLRKPEVLLLDEPFMGLDPQTLLTLSPLLYDLAKVNAPRLVLTLRPQDPIPEWITHLIFLQGTCEIAFQGPKDDVLRQLMGHLQKVKDGKIEPNLDIPLYAGHELGRKLTSKGIEESGWEENQILKASSSTLPKKIKKDEPQIGEALVEMQGAHVKYGTKSVLGNWTQHIDGCQKDGLWWTIRRGERWGIFGPNGSGKTTLLSLVSSDHPQTYSLPIRIFGRSRLPEPGKLGISIFDIQARLGQSSPEIHNHIPRSLTVRQVLENAWSETFRGLPKLNDSARERIDACLRWFKHDFKPSASFSPHSESKDLFSSRDELRSFVETQAQVKPSWAEEILFGELPFSAQRVALFLRAVVKQPDIVILDESFSGMDDGVRDRCLLFLAYGERKRYAYSNSQDGGHVKGRRRIVESNISKAGHVKVSGLSKHQALICISHVKEEVPGSIREWICLPEANTGNPPRIGRLKGPLEEDYRGWNEIWNMSS